MTKFITENKSIQIYLTDNLGKLDKDLIYCSFFDKYTFLEIKQNII